MVHRNSSNDRRVILIGVIVGAVGAAVATITLCPVAHEREPAIDIAAAEANLSDQIETPTAGLPSQGTATIPNSEPDGDENPTLAVLSPQLRQLRNFRS